MQPDVDVVVIGAGPAGLAATLNLARAQRSVALLDSNRPRHAATLQSHGFITRDGISPLELRGMGREEVLRYPTVSFERTTVRQVVRVDGGFAVQAEQRGASAESETRASAVLIATGLSETLPASQHVRPWYGTSLHSCMDCDAYDKRGQALALIGETPDLVDRAMVIRRHTDDLAVFTNGSDAVSEAGAERLAAHGVALERTPIAAIEGDRDGMRAIVLEDGRRSERTGGFVRPWWHPQLEFAEPLGLDTDDDGLVVVDRAQRASVEGIYAAGDITPGFRQLSVAAGAGTIAASVINRDLIAREL
ncbi:MULTISPECIES: NAD(P)/FAD-dependent oxidoreductase [Agrococcus]|uniref:NAD(P)/FAD-dependent oxidoreductase n=1 Tax=Agrococcus TaxID=46352 RepID=UPI00047E2977|nr:MULTISPECIES: NAD(P)/FAD-dependent oxidoreductase [Agrococcus]MBO1770805.1 NAD(P)/FAD-dependent oxidoreductase [Agrococcus sp. TF02-05]